MNQKNDGKKNVSLHQTLNLIVRERHIKGVITEDTKLARIIATRNDGDSFFHVLALEIALLTST